MRRSLATLSVAAMALLGAQRLAGQSPPPTRPASSAPERFTVQVDGHPLAVWGRRPATSRGSILLIHGRTWSSRPDFDLQVPGMQRSVMMSLAAHGIAAYALDLRGYGETPRDATGWLTPKRAAADIVAVLGWIAGQHANIKPALLGWSRGAAAAQLATQNMPSRVSALILFGFAYDPDAQFLDSPAPEKPPMEKNNAGDAASDFISPLVTPPSVVRAFVEQALRADPVLADLKNDAEFNALKPKDVKVPTLMLYGERDPGVVHDDAAKFFARLGTGDRQLVVLPGADHVAQLEDTHELWIATVVNFLNRPAVRR